MARLAFHQQVWKTEVLSGIKHTASRFVCLDFSNSKCEKTHSHKCIDINGKIVWRARYAVLDRGLRAAHVSLKNSFHTPGGYAYYRLKTIDVRQHHLWKILQKDVVIELYVKFVGVLQQGLWMVKFDKEQGMKRLGKALKWKYSLYTTSSTCYVSRRLLEGFSDRPLLNSLTS